MWQFSLAYSLCFYFLFLLFWFLYQYLFFFIKLSLFYNCQIIVIQITQHFPLTISHHQTKIQDIIGFVSILRKTLRLCLDKWKPTERSGTERNEWNEFHHTPLIFYVTKQWDVDISHSIPFPLSTNPNIT